MRSYKLKTAALVLSVLLMCGCTDISQGGEIPVMETKPPEEPEVTGIRLITPDDTLVSYEHVEPDTEAFHRQLEIIRAENDAYGMGVAVFHGGDVIYTDSLGLADIENNIPVTKDTHFRAASVSKLISTIPLMQLCEIGTISLEDVLDDATGLPYTVSGSGSAKLWHLLTHTAGITDTTYFENGSANRYTVGFILKKSLTGVRPGTSYNYTNFGAGTIGAVIECLTGKFFHDYANENLFQPLGMDAGYIIDLIEDKESCAVIYDHDGEVYHVPEWNRTRSFYESFGLGNSYLTAQCELLITPSDLARLGTALAGDGTVRECGGKRILSEDSIEKMHNVYIKTDSFGMGLNVRKYDGTLVPGRVIYGHPGNALGAITGIFYDRDDGSGVVIMTNHCNYGVDDGSGMYRLLYDTLNAAYKCFFTRQ